VQTTLCCCLLVATKHGFKPGVHIPSPVLTGGLLRPRMKRFQLALLRTPSSLSAQISSHLMGSSARYQMMLLREHSQQQQQQQQQQQRRRRQHVSYTTSQCCQPSACTYTAGLPPEGEL
jgi:hypothetical protein